MDPRTQLTTYLTGKWIPPVLAALAHFEVAEHIAAHGPSRAEDIASARGADGSALYRVMRAAASVGVFAESDDGRFHLTEMADLLRGDANGSLRAPALMFTLDPFWSPYASIVHSVATGRPAFDERFGMSIYAYLGSHPEEAAVFGAAAATFHAEGLRAIAEAVELDGVSTIADLGGGNGALLVALLRRYHDLRGILLETEGVLDTARLHVAESGLDGRVELVAGNFFDTVPEADAYVIKSCLHNFDDPDVIRVLRTVATRARPGAVVLIAETVVPPGNDPHYAKFDDVEMLVVAGGADRTEKQYRALIEQAGLEFTRSVPAGERFTLLETRCR